ncbi:MAG: TolC family protein [Pelagibacteraceae bacterium]|jgi:outer membrane protein|nr:TolC family protein [Pelagibacteraceae bacterium]
MKFLVIIVFFFSLNSVFASEFLTYLESAYKNNPTLNAERQNYKAIKENINISRSEFLPSVTVSGSQNSQENSNQKNQGGAKQPDTNITTETKSVSVDQKIFQGFQGYNSIKKSQLESEQAAINLKNVEQQVLLKSVTVYYDLAYKIRNKMFNLANVDLFERQVETDASRLQKGEITLTDLAQSESSLAGANAQLISADTELLVAKSNFERVIRMSPPSNPAEENFIEMININFPNSVDSVLVLSEKYNPKLLLAKLDYEISRKNVNIEKSKFSPSASVNYTKSQNKDFSSTVDELDQETIKATVTIPLFKGGENYSSLKKSQFKKKQINLILQDIINEVKTDSINAWSVYRSSKSVLKSTQAQLEAAEIANEGITLEYDSGNTRTTLEVVQSRSLLLDARISNAKAERDFAVSKFKLLAVIGELTLDNLNKF